MPAGLALCHHKDFANFQEISLHEPTSERWGRVPSSSAGTEPVSYANQLGFIAIDLKKGSDLSSNKGTFRDQGWLRCVHGLESKS